MKDLLHSGRNWSYALDMAGSEEWEAPARVGAPNVGGGLIAPGGGGRVADALCFRFAPTAR